VWATTAGRRQEQKRLPFDEVPVKGDVGPFKRTPAPPPPGLRLWTVINGIAKHADANDERLCRPLYACHLDTCSVHQN